MNSKSHPHEEHSYLKRLSDEFYQGQACVHWTMTMENRQTGWRKPIFFYKFREILTHTTFRFGLCCPIFCLMPDHIHMLWMGLYKESDQLLAAKFIRKQLNFVLEKLKAKLQKQGHDHVLREDELQKDAFESLVEYIALNPVRAGLVAQEAFQKYPYTSCLVPGYPELNLWQNDFWDRFWHIRSFLIENGMMKHRNLKSNPE